MRNAVVSVPAPYRTLVLQVGPSDELCDVHRALLSRLPQRITESCYLSCRNAFSGTEDIYLTLATRCPGGKGGFGSQLRAAGGRMRKGQKPDKDSMKDVNGRRLRTLKKAKSLAEALRDAPEKERKAREEERARLMAILDKELPGTRNIKFDDEEYIAQSETILENIKAAMEAAHAEEEQDEDEDDSSSEAEVGSSSSFKHLLRKSYVENNVVNQPPRKVVGWDDEDDDDDDEQESPVEDVSNERPDESPAEGEPASKKRRL